MTVQRIVFVCSGNICRSPMAAALAEKMLAEARIDAVVISAGTLGIQNTPAATNAILALQELGIPLEHHRSQGISLALLRASDHIVVMSPHHAEEILQRDPKLASKIRRLWEHAEPAGRLAEIADPVGLDLESFVECRVDLEQCLRNWIKRLR